MGKRIFLLPLLIVFLSGCTSTEKPTPTPEPTPQTTKVESVSLNETTKNLEVGETFKLIETVLPENATNKTVSWISSDSNVATVNEGLVTAISKGNTTITVKTIDQEKTAACSFTIIEKGELIHVESISVDQQSVSLQENESISIVATVLPENATDKTIRWESEDTTVATVKSGTIKAEKEGSTKVNAFTNDGNFKATIDVTVVSVPPVPPSPVEETKTVQLTAKKYSSKDIQPLTTIDVEDAHLEWSKGLGDYDPGYFTSKGGSFRLYFKNTLVISSTKGNIKSIEFSYNSDKDTPSLPLVSDKGTINSDYTKWIGNEKTITFTANGTSGSRAFYTIDITYITNPQRDPIDLGEKTINEVKEYISNAVEDGSLEVNKYGMGADKLTTVTIKGFAISKLRTVKTAEKYGYNITEPNKVVLGDSTDAIAVASKIGDGTLYNKVGDNQMKSESKYIVKGYISVALGMPELICTSFTWDKTLDIKIDFDKISKSNITIPEFTTIAQNLQYNVSGFAYGETYTLKDLTCYYAESDGQGRTWYNFTDGTYNIRVNAYNIDRVSVGSTYNITGVISMEKYSPIIVAYKFTKSSANPVDLSNFYKNADEMSIENLKKIKYVNDTENKYPEMISNYSKIYKTTGYITTVEENNNYYLSISDTFIDSKTFINGKGSSSIKYNLSLIKNNNFWNIDDPYGKFNPYNEVTDANEKVTVYYIPRQTEFYNGTMYWEILLIPQSIPTLDGTSAGPQIM